MKKFLKPETIKERIKMHNSDYADSMRIAAYVRKSRIEELQKRCLHGEQTYHPDFNGNNSYYKCNYCGKKV